ncbi:MAG: aspartate--tRNA(Asn) ligase [Candidatus Wukongarchaeota archaeon]|nr:aspartate--tRNA(Asn) ligase [Candidatus Wukongarchaeota archaeon]
MSRAEWKRTHYSVEVTPNIEGKEVVVNGNVLRLRKLGKLKFFVLQDNDGIIQITARKGEVNEGIMEKIEQIDRNDALSVAGIVKVDERAPRSVEIIPAKIEILNKSEPLPYDPLAPSIETGFDTRLKWRVIDFRNPKVRSTFLIKSEITNITREFFHKRKFTECFTSKITSAATEGGAEVFPILYFDRPAFLTMSPQLYKQFVVGGGFEKFFEIGPVYRAEKHRTRRHLNEFWGIDIEVGFATENDVMNILEELIWEVYKEVKKRREKDFEILEREIEVPKRPFKSLTYDKCVNMLEKEGEIIEWGKDFSTPQEKKLVEMINEPFFITDYPWAIKPFYIARHEDDPKLSYGFDFIYEIELTSGGRREHRVEKLIENLKDKGLEPKNFEFYLKAFRYGIPPHAGWGLGLERLLMIITGAPELRETVMFPRTVEDIEP